MERTTPNQEDDAPGQPLTSPHADVCRDGLIQQLRTQLGTALQEVEDQKGIIASLTHHAEELTLRIQDVDPAVIAEIQACGCVCVAVCVRVWVKALPLAWFC